MKHLLRRNTNYGPIGRYNYGIMSLLVVRDGVLVLKEDAET